MSKDAKYLVREGQEGKDETQLASIFTECFWPTNIQQVKKMTKNAKEESSDWARNYVAEVDGKVVSNVLILLKELSLGEGISVKTGGIDAVCTCPNHRRHGIMTNLLQQCLDYIKKGGISNSSLSTSLLLPAHRIYQRLGFYDVQAWSVYTKIIDYNGFFRSRIRNLNRRIKTSKIVRMTLQDWDRSIVFELNDESTLSLRYNNGRFRVLPKPSRNPGILITTNTETLTRIMWEAIKFEDAMKTAEFQVKKGSTSDLKILRKILIGIWDD